jgi:hypothetical protein
VPARPSDGIPKPHFDILGVVKLYKSARIFSSAFITTTEFQAVYRKSAGFAMGSYDGGRYVSMKEVLPSADGLKKRKIEKFAPLLAAKLITSATCCTSEQFVDVNTTDVCR